jgi:hypothetical protein
MVTFREPENGWWRQFLGHYASASLTLCVTFCNCTWLIAIAQELLLRPQIMAVGLVFGYAHKTSLDAIPCHPSTQKLVSDKMLG